MIQAYSFDRPTLEHTELSLILTAPSGHLAERFRRSCVFTSRSRSTMRVIVILLAALLALSSISASAQPRRRQPRRQPQAQPTGEEAAAIPTLRDLDTIVPRLSSANPDEVREAIDLLSVIDHPDVIPHLATLLRSGQPDPITDRAI